MVCEGNAVSPVDAQRTVACKYARAGQIVARTANGVRQTYEYDRKGQLLAVKDSDGNTVERYAYDKAGNMLKKTLRIGRGDSPSRPQYQTTTFTFDAANQIISSTTDGVTTRYTYDAAGRLVREGSKTYRYGYLDKVMSVTDGDTTRTFTYHADGQLARATCAAGNGSTSEDFLWDGLALIQRGDEQFVNEPHVGGGNPVASSKGTSYFNDMLGTTVGSKKDGKYSAAALTAFGENLSVDSPTPTQNSNFFTGKPMVEGLGHAFWMRNYRAGLAKWQTADPMGYPDGWNQLAYCRNGVVDSVDLWGAGVVYVETQWKYNDSTGIGYPMLSVFKFMKDAWDKGTAVMGALKIKTVKDLAEKAMSDLSDEEKEALKKWFDDGMWFDALMKADSENGGASACECVRPTDSDIDAAIAKKLGKDADYTIVSVTLDSIDPYIDDNFSGAWFIKGCKFKWKVVYE